MSSSTPAVQLAAFLGKYDPAIAAFARRALTKLRRHLPGATELVYDNYNALVVGFGPTEKPSEAIFSLVVYPRWVSLFFLQGARLPDPKSLLRGTGAKVRHIVLQKPGDLESGDVERLIAAGLRSAAKPIDPAQRRKLIIRSVSAKQRPRRAA